MQKSRWVLVSIIIVIICAPLIATATEEIVDEIQVVNGTNVFGNLASIQEFYNLWYYIQWANGTPCINFLMNVTSEDLDTSYKWNISMWGHQDPGVDMHLQIYNNTDWINLTNITGTDEWHTGFTTIGGSWLNDTTAQLRIFSDAVGDGSAKYLAIDYIFIEHLEPLSWGTTPANQSVDYGETLRLSLNVTQGHGAISVNDYAVNDSDFYFPQGTNKSDIAEFNFIGDTTLIVNSTNQFHENLTEQSNIYYTPGEDRELKLCWSGWNGTYSTMNCNETVYCAWTNDTNLFNWTFYPSAIINASEDPYIYKCGGSYYIAAENKKQGATFRNISIWRIDDFNFDNASSVYITDFDISSNAWESQDVSSPTVYCNDTSECYMYYEGRGAGSNGIGLAITTDCTTWARWHATDAVIYANQTAVDGLSAIVPDDIIYNNNMYYMTIHAGGILEKSFLINSSTLDSYWTEFNSTAITSDNSDNAYMIGVFNISNTWYAEFVNESFPRDIHLGYVQSKEESLLTNKNLLSQGENYTVNITVNDSHGYEISTEVTIFVSSVNYWLNSNYTQVGNNDSWQKINTNGYMWDTAGYNLTVPDLIVGGTGGLLEAAAGGNISVTNLTIESSSVLNASNETITVSGDFSNSGTFTNNSGTVIFSGASSTLTGQTDFNYVEVSGNLTLNSEINQSIINITSTGNLTYNASNFDDSAYYYKQAGGYVSVSNGNLTSNASFYNDTLIIINTTGSGYWIDLVESGAGWLIAGLSNSVACSTNAECDSGYCVHSVCRAASTFCGDAFCDTGETYSSCYSDCEAPATSTSALGRTTTPTSVTKSAIFTNVESGAELKATILANQIYVTEVTTTAAESSDSAKISVSNYDSKPDSVPDPAYEVHQYLDISSNIKTKTAEIIFKVSDKWLEERGASSDDVVLLHHNKTSWQELPTQHISEESYRAVTNSFSTFAISIKTRQVKMEGEPQVSADKEEMGGSTESVKVKILALLFTLLVIGYIYTNRRKSLYNEK